MSESKKRRSYDEAFKRDAVRLVVEEKCSFARAAEAVGVSEQSLGEWRKKYGPPPTPCGEDASATELKAEVTQLRRELKRAQMERDILKKRRRTSRRSRHEARLDPAAPRLLHSHRDVRSL